jgi:PncC family amidohydrolase
MKRHRIWAILTLALLAPSLGELLSGSSPPSEYFPIGWILQAGLYGTGALMVRDLARRWGKGWPSILLLGAAYGIYEEGIAVRSFFDPNWPDLGQMAAYGRWLGVNWVWAEWLTIYHATVSITIPILLVELLFPRHRNEPWLERTGWIICAVPFLAYIAFGPLAHMNAPVLGLLGCAAAMVLLGWLAYRWPATGKVRIDRVRPVKPGWFTVLGFLGGAGCFLIFMALPSTNLPPLVTMLQGAGLCLLVAAAAWAMGGRSWTDRHRWALAFGVILLSCLLAVAQELDNANRLNDDTSGMALVGIAFFVGMIGLGVAVWRRPLAGTLEDQLKRIFSAKGLTLATAESCTGGLLASRITDVAGSSDYFLGGVVSYAYSAKETLLGIDHDLLMSEGAVNETVARQMARSVRTKLGADVAASITGIAGPSGGTPEKPVGLVWIGLADAQGDRAECHEWKSDRVGNKERSAEKALQMLVEWGEVALPRSK